jgi:hypothetical protein
MESEVEALDSDHDDDEIDWDRVAHKRFWLPIIVGGVCYLFFNWIGHSVDVAAERSRQAFDASRPTNPWAIDKKAAPASSGEHGE